MEQRLQKIISGAGICSRRAAEALLQSGKVTVNGKTAALGDKADAEIDDIRIDGKKVGVHEEKITVMLNKPIGYVTTMSDEKGRKTVAQLVENCPVRVLPVGRLDQYSEGLLLLSSDGELIYKLTHPKNEITKRYEVLVRGEQKGINDMSKRMIIDGYMIRPAQVKIIKRVSEGEFLLSVSIHEGRNRQIRKMCAQCGLKVIRLKRVAEGGIILDKTLKAGQWRRLTEKEMKML